MAGEVTQAYVTATKALLLTELQAAADSFAIKSNNGIESGKHAKDVQRLGAILKTLDTYDVTEDYFDEEYILKIRREYKNHCGFSGTAGASAVNPLPVTQTVILNLTKELIYEEATAGNITTDDGDTEIAFPSTPQVQFNVYVGRMYLLVGDGDKTHDCYFSADSGATARAVADVIAGDIMYYNAVIAGSSLLTTDTVRIEVL